MTFIDWALIFWYFVEVAIAAMAAAGVVLVPIALVVWLGLKAWKWSDDA